MAAPLATARCCRPFPCCSCSPSLSLPAAWSCWRGWMPSMLCSASGLLSWLTSRTACRSTPSRMWLLPIAALRPAAPTPPPAPALAELSAAAESVACPCCCCCWRAPLTGRSSVAVDCMLLRQGASSRSPELAPAVVAAAAPAPPALTLHVSSSSSCNKCGSCSRSTTCTSASAPAPAVTSTATPLPTAAVPAPPAASAAGPGAPGITGRVMRRAWKLSPSCSNQSWTRAGGTLSASSGCAASFCRHTCSARACAAPGSLLSALANSCEAAGCCKRSGRCLCSSSSHSQRCCWKATTSWEVASCMRGGADAIPGGGGRIAHTGEAESPSAYTKGLQVPAISKSLHQHAP